LDHITVIYDKELYYAEKLANYLNTAETFPFRVCAFTNLPELESYCKENEVEILIADESISEECDSKYYKEKIILSKNSTSSNDGISYIYKYQSIETIIHEIMTYLSESEQLSSIIKRKKRMKVISYYSPVKRSMSTTMALTMGLQLGKKYRCLYVNLEGYSSLEKQLDKPLLKDITDMLYYIESNGTNIGMQISGIVEKIESLDIIPPAKNQNELVSISFSEWKRMIQILEKETDYEYVILDLSDAIQGLYNLLLMSDYIVTCTEEDEIANYKRNQYEESLIGTDYAEILKKTRKCNVPKQNRRNGELRFLVTGELGEYVNKILQDMIHEL